MSVIDLILTSWKKNDLEKRRESVEYWINTSNEKKLFKIFTKEPEQSIRKQIVNYFDDVDDLKKLLALSKRNDKDSSKGNASISEDTGRITKKIALLYKNELIQGIQGIQNLQSKDSPTVDNSLLKEIKDDSVLLSLLTEKKSFDLLSFELKKKISHQIKNSKILHPWYLSLSDNLLKEEIENILKNFKNTNTPVKSNHKKLWQEKTSIKNLIAQLETKIEAKNFYDYDSFLQKVDSCLGRIAKSFTEEETSKINSLQQTLLITKKKYSSAYEQNNALEKETQNRQANEKPFRDLIDGIKEIRKKIPLTDQEMTTAKELWENWEELNQTKSLSNKSLEEIFKTIFHEITNRYKQEQIESNLSVLQKTISELKILAKAKFKQEKDIVRDKTLLSELKAKGDSEVQDLEVNPDITKTQSYLNAKDIYLSLVEQIMEKLNSNDADLKQDKNKKMIHQTINSFYEEAKNLLENLPKLSSKLGSELSSERNKSENFKALFQAERQADRFLKKWEEIIKEFESEDISFKETETYLKADQRVTELRELQKKVSKDMRYYREENLIEKEKICSILKELQDVEDLKVIYKLYKEAKHKWRMIGVVPNEDFVSLKEKYVALCKELDEKCASEVDSLKDVQEESYQSRKQLIIDLEEVTSSLEGTLNDSSADQRGDSNLANSAKQKYQKILREWKSLPPVSQENKNINDEFKEKLKEYHDKNEVFFDKNQNKMDGFLAEKKKLFLELQAIAKDNLENKVPWEEIKPKIVALDEKWQKVGRIWRSADKENIISQYQDTLEKLLIANKGDPKVSLEKKQKLLAEVNEILEASRSTDDVGDSLQKIIKVQKSWKDIHRLPCEKNQKIWREFQDTCNLFFKENKEKIDKTYAESDEKITEKENLLKELDKNIEKLKNKKVDRKELFEIFKTIKERWYDIKIPRGKGGGLEGKFRDKSDTFFKYRNEILVEHEFNAQEKLQKKQRLIIQLQYLLNVQDDDLNKKVGLAAKLKEILNLNQRQSDESISLHQKIKTIESQWRLLPRGGNDEEMKLGHTYKKLLDTYYQKIKNKKTKT